MHKMLMSAVVAAALIQGCTTKSDSVKSPVVTQTAVAQTPVTQTAAAVAKTPGSGTGYVVSKSEYVRDNFGNCLRSTGWSSDNVIVECQASSEAPVVAAVPKAEPQVARLSYNGKALFEFDSAELSLMGRQELDGLVAKMNSHNGIGEVNVVGHADSIGEPTYNQSLSEQRAATVRAYLKSACLLYTSPSPRDLSTSRMPSSA